MICDMVSKPTGKPRGRPTGTNKALRHDPFRQSYAYLLAGIWRCQNRGFSERETVKTAIAYQDGELCPDTENIEAFSSGRPFKVYKSDFDAKKKRLGIYPNLPASEQRYANVFEATAENLSRKLRRILALPEDNDDRKWLYAMTSCWYVALETNNRDLNLMTSLFGVYSIASHFASIAGETEYFAQQIKPIIDARLAA